MRSRTIICAAAIAALGASFGASAQGYGRRDEQRQPAHDQRADHDAGRRPDDRAMGNRGERQFEAREWHKGDRLPPEYRSRQYVVERWREHRLAPPPRGYEWVQVGADFVLISTRTGVVAQVAVVR